MAQVASLIEVINLVDYITRQQTQLNMEEIETTYVNLLGGKDAIEHHVPSFSRKWLKDRILQASPNLRSVLPKNKRKSAIVYSLETFEKQMTIPWAISMSYIRQHHWLVKELRNAQATISRINKYKFLAVIGMFLESLRQWYTG